MSRGKVNCYPETNVKGLEDSTNVSSIHKVLNKLEVICVEFFRSSKIH